MATCLAAPTDAWKQFIEYAKKRMSPIAFSNWLGQIELLNGSQERIVLQVPNVFVQEYLLSNFKEDLLTFLPATLDGVPSIEFVIQKEEKRAIQSTLAFVEKKNEKASIVHSSDPSFQQALNQNYRFDTFIEGHTNQFVKSAALGVATRPGKSYTPLFIHGWVGLGKTHLLHSIGNYISQKSKHLRIQCITTEGFVNQIVDSLRNKSIDKMKLFYRSNIDVFLLDDFQFLQRRTNFEEELRLTFEALIHQNKQIVITSDKPPSELSLSERMIGMLEWGLVARVNMPDLETRVAILQHKAEQKGLSLPSQIAFHIAERIQNNVRQLEGALNKLSAYSRLLNQEISEEFVESTLRDMFQLKPKEKLSVENILKSVSTVFDVRVSALTGTTRTKDVVIPRQVAMFLAKELISESLVMIGASFGKRTHSTILHAYKTIQEKLKEDKQLQRQVDMVRQNLGR